MTIVISPPWPPVFHDPFAFHLGMVVGFAVVVLATVFADKLGTYLFHQGYAKPFYVRGRRIHHFWIYFIIPSAYVAFCVLLLMGYVLLSPIWSLPLYQMYERLATVFAIAAACMAFDFLGDRLFTRERKERLLHHEWAYTLILVYVIQFIVQIRV